MGKTHLQGATIGSLSDGYVGRIVDKSLDAIVADLDDRPTDRTVRKLTIEISFKPQPNGRYSISTDVKTKLPAFRPPETIAKMDASGGGLLFSPDFSENPDQKTFVDDQEPAKSARHAAG